MRSVILPRDGDEGFNLFRGYSSDLGDGRIGSSKRFKRDTAVDALEGSQ